MVVPPREWAKKNRLLARLMKWTTDLVVVVVVVEVVSVKLRRSHLNGNPGTEDLWRATQLLPQPAATAAMGRHHHHMRMTFQGNV